MHASANACSYTQQAENERTQDLRTAGTVACRKAAVEDLGRSLAARVLRVRPDLLHVALTLEQTYLAVAERAKIGTYQNAEAVS